MKYSERLFVWELLLLGGGRILPLPTRVMSLSAVFLSYFISRRRSKEWILIIVICCMLIFYTMVGVLRENNIYLIEQDLRSYSFLVAWPFIARVALNNGHDSIVNAILIAGMLLCGAKLILFSMLFFNAPMFLNLAYYFEARDELRFRPFPLFVMKADFFIVLATFILAVSSAKRIWFLPVLTLFVASLYITLTRGFYLTLISGLVFYTLLRVNLTLRLCLLPLAMLVFSFFYVEVHQLLSANLDRAASDSDRLSQFIALSKIESLSMYFWGGGFGAKIDGNAKSEIFIIEYVVKFGVPVSIIAITAILYYPIIDFFSRRQCWRSAVLSTLIIMLVVQSLTNSYLTNNIGGLTVMLLITLRHRFPNGKKIL